MPRLKHSINHSVPWLPVLVCLMIVSLCACSSSKSRKDDDILVQGTTVSLEELEYSEGLAEPLPEETPPPESQSAVLPESKDVPLSAAPPARLRHPKKRLFVLPFKNSSDYRDHPYGEIVAQRLMQALEASGQVVVLDGQLLDRFLSENGIARENLLEAFWTKELHKTFGVHVVVSGSLTHLNVAATRSSVSQDVEVGLAIARIKARLVDASTANIIRTYTGRNPLYKSKEIGEFNQERSILRAIDIGVDEVAQGLLNALGHFDWSARVVRVEPDRVYIDAGQQSGLRVGDILDVYAPGQEIINPLTQLSLGWAPGLLKGRIEISGFFGIDAAYATPLEGDNFSPEDLVKASQRQPE